MNRFFIFIFLLIFISGCDVVQFIAIKNPENSQQKVTVHYDQTKRTTFWDSDSLKAYALNLNLRDTIVIRENLKDESYQFLTPKNYKVESQPKSIGTPIKKIIIESATDTLVVHLKGENRNLRKLKKKGKIKT